MEFPFLLSLVILGCAAFFAIIALLVSGAICH
jgi:hypothetical protein